MEGLEAVLAILQRSTHMAVEMVALMVQMVVVIILSELVKELLQELLEALTESYLPVVVVLVTQWEQIARQATKQVLVVTEEAAMGPNLVKEVQEHQHWQLVEQRTLEEEAVVEVTDMAVATIMALLVAPVLSSSALHKEVYSCTH